VHLCERQDVAEAGVPGVEVSQLAALAAQPQLQREQQPSLQASTHGVSQLSKLLLPVDLKNG
jgi:hypothetical protein